MNIHIIMNSIQIYETVFLNLYNDHEFKKSQHIAYYPNSAKTAVIVDSRFNPLMESVIRNFMHFLSPHEWNLCIVSYSNYETQIKSIFPNCIFKEMDEKYIYFKDNIPNITISSYNKMFLDANFWKELPGEHFLFFQTDCIMYKMFDDSFLDYDYCGANYYNEQSVFYGGLNGGCSLRKKKAMIDCIENTIHMYTSGSKGKSPHDTFDMMHAAIQTLVEYKIDVLSLMTKHNRLIKHDDQIYSELNHLKQFVSTNELFNCRPFYVSALGKYGDEQTNTNGINEDVFFSHVCELLLKSVPDKIHRTFFAIEVDYNINTCFYHGWNKNYQSVDEAIQIIKHSPFLCKYLTPLHMSNISTIYLQDKSCPQIDGINNIAD
jgi:hypothetical protein